MNHADFRASYAAAALAAGLVVALVAGCTGYSPAGFTAGATREQVAQAMGQPTGLYPLPGGGSRVEYARGPFGKQTYMLDFDAQGRLQQWQQVLTEKNFDELPAGIDQNEVLMRLGRPSSRFGIHYQNETVWAYRYESPFCKWFQVGIGPEGKVLDTAYGTDPLCDHDGRGPRR